MFLSLKEARRKNDRPLNISLVQIYRYAAIFSRFSES